jgi:hypothetical protein
MNIFGTKAPIQQRLVSVICAIKEHDYCLREKNVACTCSCHYAPDWIVEGDRLVDFAFKLWEISGSLPAMDDDVREKIFRDLITAAEGTVNFEGLTADEIATRLRFTLSQTKSWSARDTRERLGLED